jgi:NSS family neurotransmitter:Na+ symporter
MAQKAKREQWGSKIGFILAAAGSAIGLGNIWKFPYIAGVNGGAAFVIIYLASILVVGMPVLMAEILIGRTAHRNPVGAFKKLSNGSKFWTAVGGMGVLAGFFILSYYVVIAGWALGYVVEAAKGVFFEFKTPADAGAHFNSLIENVEWIIGYFALFMALTMVFVLGGVQKGIEKGSKIMMPILFVLLIILVVRGITLDGAEKGISFLVHPDWSAVTPTTVLLALGQAFFTLSLGMGAMLTYGSYMSDNDNITTSGLEIVILDTAIALFAGFAIFTAVFAFGQNPAAGAGLIFQTLPVVFSQMPGGYVFSIAFFILLTIAALTSAISLLEVITAYFVDEKGWSRKNAAIVFGGITFVLGIPSALSYNVMSDVHFFGMTFFDFIDYISSNILLPVGGFLIAVFVAYFWGLDKAVANLKKGAENFLEKNTWIIGSWKFFIKYIAPILIIFVFLNSIGVI